MKYKIINDSGVPYSFMKGGFGTPSTPWVGQVVEGNKSSIPGCVIVEKPFGISGTYTADETHFEEVKP